MKHGASMCFSSENRWQPDVSWPLQSSNTAPPHHLIQKSPPHYPAQVWYVIPMPWPHLQYLPFRVIMAIPVPRSHHISKSTCSLSPRHHHCIIIHPARSLITSLTPKYHKQAHLITMILSACRLSSLNPILHPSTQVDIPGGAPNSLVTLLQYLDELVRYIYHKPWNWAI